MELGKITLHPLSTGQFNIWLGQRLDPESPAYNIGEYIEILGPVDPGRFEAALRELLGEIDALHLRVSETDDGPRQYIVRDLEWTMPFIDLAGEVDARLAAESWMQKDMGRSTDLTRDPLFTFVLFRASPSQFFWYARTHHFCNDGVGGSLIVRRVAEIYSALTENRTAVKRNTASWLDLLDEEKTYRRSDRYVRDRNYWRQQFAERPGQATLSGKPAVRSRTFIRTTANLSATVAGGLRALSKAHGSGLPSLITAAALLYLHRFTSATDLTLGVPVTGRFGINKHSAVGMLSNVLPLRFVVEPSSRFADLLRLASKSMFQAIRHQLYRAEDLRRDLGLRPEETATWGTMVNVMPFDYNLRFGDSPARPHNLSCGPVDDLSIVVYDRHDGLDLRIDFDANPDHYSMEMLVSHQRRFLFLLSQLATTTTDRLLSRYEILDSEERHKVLEEFNSTAIEYPKERCVHDLFGEQVERTPDAVAVVCEEERLSYRQLNAGANQLAHYLRDLGVGPETLVGICIERSTEMIIALLGILKAGGAYLPLDPAYPQDRLFYMLDDAAPALILSTALLRARLPQSMKVLDLDNRELQSALKKLPTDDLTDAKSSPSLRPQHPAYVIYTSGSTGTPKGVIVTHGGLTNNMLWMLSEYPVSQEDVVLGRTAIAFDSSVWEIWLPLIAGATLCIAPGRVMRDPSELIAYLDQHGVTMAQFVPSLLASIFSATGRSRRPSLRRVFLSGEAFPATLAKEVSSIWGVSLANLYGPTETTVQVTSWRWDETERDDRAIPIGKPIWNTRLYVLDRYGEPVPIGVEGELYIGGAGLARGYLNRPELTAEKFVPDPFSGITGGRLYKSGDRCRWRPDGNLEFVGRIDRQIKLRGFRIELGEIEAALCKHQDVKDSVVAVKQRKGAEKSLIAYVVANGLGREAELRGALKGHLRGFLPEYMVPAEYAFLERLPLTTNGKIDRKALPEPEERYRFETYVAPRNATEQILAKIWANVLGRERIGIHENFFDLGGHSLLAVRMVAEVEMLIGRRLSISALFQAPTVAALAQLLAKKESTPAGSAGESRTANRSIVPIRPEGSKPPLFFLHTVSGEVLLYRHLVPHFKIDQPIFGIRATQVDNDPASVASIEELAATYIREIIEVCPEGPYHLVGYSYGGLLAFEIARQLKLASKSVGLLAILDTVTAELNIRWSKRERIAQLTRRVRRRFEVLKNEHWKTRFIKDRISAEDETAQYVTQVEPEYVHVARALRGLAAAWEPKPFPGKAILFRARDRNHTIPFGSKNGWQRLVHDLQVRELDCDHRSLVWDPCAGQVAAQLIELLGK